MCTAIWNMRIPPHLYGNLTSYMQSHTYYLKASQKTLQLAHRAHSTWVLYHNRKSWIIRLFNHSKLCFGTDEEFGAGFVHLKTENYNQQIWGMHSSPIYDICTNSVSQGFGLGFAMEECSSRGSVKTNGWLAVYKQPKVWLVQVA